VISVSEKARDYILLKGGCVHVWQSHGATRCWVPVNFGPSVRLGKPPQTNDYVLATLNGITIYTPKNFHTPNSLIIGLGEFLWMKNLRIEGWKLI